MPQGSGLLAEQVRLLPDNGLSTPEMPVPDDPIDPQTPDWQEGQRQERQFIHTRPYSHVYVAPLYLVPAQYTDDSYPRPVLDSTQIAFPLTLPQ